MAALDWDGPVYQISALSGDGTDLLCQDIMIRLETLREQEAEDPEAAALELERQQALQAEARERIGRLRQERRAERAAPDDSDDDDDYDVEVEYVP